MKMLMLATLLLSQMLAAAVDSSDTNLVVLDMQPPTLHPIHMSPESPTTETIRKGGVPKALSPTTNPSASPAAIIDITHETKTPSDTVGFDSIPTPMPTSQPSRSITNAPSPNPFSSPPSKETQQPITSNPAESPTSNPKKGGSRASDSDVQSIGFVRNQLFSPICTIYFPDKSILDEQSVSSFEDTAKRFVHDNLSKINLPIVIVNVKGVTIVSQVLSWKRPSRRLRAEGAATGLDVYFQIDVVATGYTTKEELENSFQELFDSNNNLFQSSIDIAAASEDQFNLTQLTLVVAASCSGFVALMLTMSIFIWKKTGKGSKRQLSSPKPVKAKAKSSPKVKYPVQEARRSRRESRLVSDHASSSRDSSSQSSASDEMDNMSFDNSFCPSLRFCPSVEKRDEEVNELFTCNQSIIIKDDEPCDEETFNSEWNKKDSTGATASTIQLSKDDLNSFDDELRRAEC